MISLRQSLLKLIRTRTDAIPIAGTVQQKHRKFVCNRVQKDFRFDVLAELDSRMMSLPIFGWCISSLVESKASREARKCWGRRLKNHRSGVARSIGREDEWLCMHDRDSDCCLCAEIWRGWRNESSPLWSCLYQKIRLVWRWAFHWICQVVCIIASYNIHSGAGSCICLRCTLHFRGGTSSEQV